MSYKARMHETLDDTFLYLQSINYDFKQLNKSSRVWSSSAISQKTRNRFIAAATTFTIKITPLITKYHYKESIEGEFIADVFGDYYHDLLQCALDDLDDELVDNYLLNPLDCDNPSDEELADAMEGLIANLYSRCQHPKQLIKTLKQVYRNHQAEINAVTKVDGQSKPDLDCIADISANYRDYLY